MSDVRKPVPKDAWWIVKLFQQRFRLTHQEVGDMLGVSASRVKQGVNGYQQYKSPVTGKWTITKGGKPVADGGEGSSEGGAG